MQVLEQETVAVQALPQVPALVALEQVLGLVALEQGLEQVLPQQLREEVQMLTKGAAPELQQQGWTQALAQVPG